MATEHTGGGFMSCLDVKINPDGDVTTDCLPLLMRIRPGWSGKDIKHERLTGGVVNTLVVFHLAEDTEKKDALVFRIYSSYGGTLEQDDQGDVPGVLSRDGELMAMQIGSTVSCAPPVAASFFNGLVYKYMHGRTLKVDDLEDPRVVRQVASSIASLHRVDAHALKLVNRKGVVSPLPFEPGVRYVRILKWFISMAPEKLKDPERDERYQPFKARIPEITEELGVVSGILEELAPPVSFCHNDPHGLNLIYNDSTGHATLVDWDLSEFNYCCYDAAVFFILPRYLHGQNVDAASLLEEPRQWHVWRDTYLSKMAELSADDTAGSNFRSPYCVTSQEALATQKRCLDVEFHIFMILHHFVFTVICIFLESLATPVDFTRLLPVSWDTYQKMKTRLPELKSEYLRLRKELEKYQQN